MNDEIPIIECHDLVAGYAGHPVIAGIELTVLDGEIVTFVGHNGAGKSTLLKTLTGSLPPVSGQILYRGGSFHAASLRSRAWRLEVAFVPQGHVVFPNITVQGHLEMVASIHRLPAKQWKQQLSEFPALASRLDQYGSTLSGGERQMLALLCALLPSPHVLVLDEPSIGLSPALATAVFSKIGQLNAEHGTTILIAEQNVRAALSIAHRVVGLREGRICFLGNAQEVEHEDLVRKILL